MLFLSTPGLRVQHTFMAEKLESKTGMSWNSEYRNRIRVRFDWPNNKVRPNLAYEY